MTDKQQHEIEIQRSIMSVMEQNLSIWRSVPELKNKYDLFVRNLKKIEDHQNMAGTDLAPYREKKLGSMKTLLQKAIPVISVLGVYAKDTGNTKLNKLVNLNADELETMNPDALRKYFRRILRICRALMEQDKGDGLETHTRKISDYGLTENHLEMIREALDQFISDQDTFKNQRIEIKRYKNKLDRRIRENNIILKTQLNKMILLFRDSNKEFYESYLKATGKRF